MTLKKYIITCYIAFSVINTLILTCICYFTNNFLLFAGENFNQYLLAQKVCECLGWSKKIDYDDAIFINVSYGNKILVQFLPMYLSVIRHGGMLICDEFSSGLHNDLEELLIRYFMKHAEQAQIFIVSHSTNLLSSSLFRPDQLYAVNFDQEGSNIVRFSSEQPRTAQNYEKMYLGGVFSGIPQYKDV